MIKSVCQVICYQKCYFSIIDTIIILFIFLKFKYFCCVLSYLLDFFVCIVFIIQFYVLVYLGLVILVIQQKKSLGKKVTLNVAFIHLKGIQKHYNFCFLSRLIYSCVLLQAVVQFDMYARLHNNHHGC